MLRANLRVLYLHGFASSPESRKARFFSERLHPHGVHLETPDLAKGNFSKLTITGQLQVIEELLDNQPAVLIGSSFGGYLAALYAHRYPSVSRLLLLAPAFRFHQLWMDRITPEQLAAWKRDDALPFFHYGTGREEPLGYGFIEDAAAYQLLPPFRQPAMIFHGTGDSVVPIDYSAEFVQNHPNARLVPLSSGHELTDVLDQIWTSSKDFLLGPISISE